MDPIVEKLVSLYAKAPFGAVEKNPNLLKGEFDAAPEELANQ